jgi:hypothetical protein
VETSSTGVSDHPIFSKTRNNRHVEVERMLKALDFDPNVRDKHGNTVRTALVLSQIQAPTFAHTRPAKGRLTSALTVYVIHIQDRSW